MDSITLEEALDLTKLPRELGETPDGVPLAVNIGRFGPYVRVGDKFVSLGKDDDPYTISLERAVELVEEKKRADAAKQIKVFEVEGIKVLNGRYGPYVTDGKRNARVPKETDPAALDLEACRTLLESAPARRGPPRRGGRTRKA